MTFEPSKYQQAIFEEVKSGNDSLLIQACAGSGKTTSIVKAVALHPPSYRILFLAFNKRIVEELQSRLPKHVECSTFNSCGFKALRNYFGRFVPVDANKTSKIIRQNFRDEDFERYASFVSKMVSLAKSAGMGGALLPNIPESWEELRNHHDIFLSHEDATYDRAYFLAQKVLEKSIDISRTTIDFDDQIFLPYYFRANFDQYDRVYVDELQDVSETQIEILKKLIKPDGKLIGVGDRQQSLYGFRGADHTAMDKVREAFNCKELPLSISYRCCKSVIRAAQVYVPHIEAFEHAPEGEVKEIEKYNASDFLPTDLVVARNTKPLVSLAYGLISRGVGVNFPGRDFSAGLKNLIRDMKARDLVELSIKLSAYVEKQIEKLTKKGQENQIEIVQDKVDCVLLIMEHLSQDRQTVNALLDEIDFLFSEKAGCTSIMTIHKSKGMESDRVYFLDRELLPSKYATKPWMLIQENNLIYVAITRAKTSLFYISSGCFVDEDYEQREARRNKFFEEKAKTPTPTVERKHSAGKVKGVALSALLNSSEK